MASTLRKPIRSSFLRKRSALFSSRSVWTVITPRSRKGGLRLDHREAWKRGGDSGAAVVPGDPKGSSLLRSIRHEEDDLKMPSKAPKFDAAVIADFEAWVKMGAPDPRDEPSKTAESEGKSGGKSAAKWEQSLAMRRTWWSCNQSVLWRFRPGKAQAVRCIRRIVFCG